MIKGNLECSITGLKAVWKLPSGSHFVGSKFKMEFNILFQCWTKNCKIFSLHLRAKLSIINVCVLFDYRPYHLRAYFWSDRTLMELSNKIWNCHQNVVRLYFFKEDFLDNHIIKDTGFPGEDDELSNISNDSHSAELSRIKQRVNKMNKWVCALWNRTTAVQFSFDCQKLQTFAIFMSLQSIYPISLNIRRVISAHIRQADSREPSF